MKIDYCIIPNKRTPSPNKCAPPPFFMYPVYPESRVAWKNLPDSSLLRVAMST